MIKSVVDKLFQRIRNAYTLEAIIIFVICGISIVLTAYYVKEMIIEDFCNTRAPLYIPFDLWGPSNPYRTGSSR